MIEIAFAYGLLEGALWSTGVSQLLWATTTLAFIGSATWFSSRDVVMLGVSSTGFKESAWIIPVFAAICGLMIVAASLFGTLHRLNGVRAPLWHALLYGLWALVQEFLTMSFIFVRFEEAFSSRIAILLTAVLFCAAHIPNVVLMCATFPMSLAFCWVFTRYRNIYPLAISHAALGLTLSIALSTAATHSMRVGISYFLIG